LIDVTETEEAFDGKWFFGQGEWGQLTEYHIEYFASVLRYSYQRWLEHGSLVNESAIETGTQFSWTNTVNKIKEGFHHAMVY
jgi:hypothetical protein